jgi:hypothetical protein
MGLADDAEKAAIGMLGEEQVHALLDTCKSAPAGVTSGSRPLADVVTRSTGTG